MMGLSLDDDPEFLDWREAMIKATPALAKCHVGVSIFQRGNKVLGNDFIVVEVSAGVKFLALDTHDRTSFN